MKIVSQTKVKQSEKKVKNCFKNNASNNTINQNSNNSEGPLNLSLFKAQIENSQTGNDFHLSLQLKKELVDGYLSMDAIPDNNLNNVSPALNENEQESIEYIDLNLPN